MNAIELHECMSQWPEEARPKNLRLHTAGWFVEDRETGRMAEGETRRVDFQFCNPTTAIALHVASGLEWLLKRGWCVSRYDQEAHGHTDYCLLDENKGHEMGPDLFLAIHAAIIATVKGVSHD